MTDRRILDIGAGFEPYPGATDAVDRRGAKSTYHIRKKMKHPFPKTLRYRFSIDMNKQLPYPDATFVKVVSRYSLCTFGTQNAFNEAYRVLKPGGSIMIQTGHDLNGVKKLMQTLVMAGFVEPSYRGDNLTFYIVTARK